MNWISTQRNLMIESENYGFTIIETLVAIILLGMVSTMSIVVFNLLCGNKGKHLFMQVRE